MNCQECSNLLFDYVEDELPNQDAEGVKVHLSSCPTCHQEFLDLSTTWNALDQLPKPGPELNQRFSAALAAYKKGQAEGNELAAIERKSKRSIIIRIWQNGYAQAAVIAFAFVLGALIPMNSQKEDESSERFSSIETELASLREFTALSLLTQTSAAERLRGLEWIAASGIENPTTLDALYNKLNYDPNINVRFAALETLGAYAEKSEVRQKLVGLLASPNSPMIRAEMIKLLVRHSERSSLPELNRISEDINEDETIRELARWSVLKLEETTNDEV